MTTLTERKSRQQKTATPVVDVDGQRREAAARIAEITGEAAAKRAVAVATRDADIAEWQRQQKIADTSRAKAAASEGRVIGLSFETETAVNRQRLILRDSAPPCIDEGKRTVLQMQDEARSSFVSRMVDKRGDDGAPLVTNDKRRFPELISNGGRINEFLSRSKVALAALDALIYSPLSRLEIEAEVDRILEELGPISQPRPLVLDV